MMRPLSVKPSINGIAVPLLAATAGVSLLLLKDGAVSRCDGMVLLTLFAFVLPFYCWFDQKTTCANGACKCEDGCGCAKRSAWLDWTLVVVGLSVLVASSHLLVWGSVDFAIPSSSASRVREIFFAFIPLVMM